MERIKGAIQTIVQLLTSGVFPSTGYYSQRALNRRNRQVQLDAHTLAIAGHYEPAIDEHLDAMFEESITGSYDEAA